MKCLEPWKTLALELLEKYQTDLAAIQEKKATKLFHLYVSDYSTVLLSLLQKLPALAISIELSFAKSAYRLQQFYHFITYLQC